MKVSVITSCLNRKDTIQLAIESVLAQTYTDIEYIIVDAGSTDGSREIIEKYRGRVSKIILEPDNGMYEGINKGIKAATGNVIAVCHSDDQFMNKDVVQNMVTQLVKTSADMAYANGIYIRRRDDREPARIWKSGKCRRWKLHCGWLPLHTTCFIRREVFEKYGLYDESYHIAADTKLLLQLLYKERIKTCYVPEYVVRMRMGGLSTDLNRRKHMWKEDIRVFHEVRLRPAYLQKLLKMGWKVPQYVRGLFAKRLVMRD